jgi:hypothetical protein
MTALLRPALAGSALGAVFALVVGVYLYLQHHHQLPDYLCIAPRENALVEEAPQQPGTKSILNWTLMPTNARLEKEAIIELKDANGTPVKDAEIEVGFDMPSMPMMHAIPNATARPTEREGQYKIHFKLDMAGVWIAKIHVKRPEVFRTTRRFAVE